MTKNLLIAFLLLFTVVSVAQKPVAELPRVYIDTTFSQPTGTTRPAHTAAQFTAALSAAVPGDTIVLDAGTVYTGNFTFPAKANPLNKWVYIVGSAYSSLPSPGTRVSPADAANMPKIVSPNMQPAFQIAAGAGYVRLAGIEVYSVSTVGGSGSMNPYTQSLIYGATGNTGPSCDHVTVDRSYIHGTEPTIDVRQGVTVNCSNFAVIDSYISDIHQSTYDSQAILGYFTNGPIKIVNNYLEATGENIMFTGTISSNPFVPSDIEIRNNWIRKPLSWDGPLTIPPHNKWAVKNLLEFKLGQRAPIDGNTFENVWVSAQTGWAIGLGVRVGGNLTPVVEDLTFSNNILKNVSSGFDVSGYDDSCVTGCSSPGEERRIALYNNLVLLGDTTQPGYAPPNAYSFGVLINGNLTDWVWQHNTVVAPPNLNGCRGCDTVVRLLNVWIRDGFNSTYPGFWGTGYAGTGATANLCGGAGQVTCDRGLKRVPIHHMPPIRRAS